MICRTAILIECLRIGGVEHFALDLAGHLNPESWEAHVICLADDEPHDSSRLPRHLHRTSLQNCSQLLRELKPELLSLHLRDNSPQFLQTLPRLPLVITTETPPAFGVDHAAAVYPSGAFCPQPTATERVITPGVASARLRNGEGWRIRAELNIDDDAFVLGWIGRMTAESDCNGLLSSFARTRKEFPETILVIVGDGPQGEELIRRSREDDLAGSIRFAGLRTDLADLFSCFGALIIPSTRQHFPLVALEAYAAGIPVIVTPEIYQVLPDDGGWTVGSTEEAMCIAAEAKSTAVSGDTCSMEQSAESYSQLFSKVISGE